MAETIVSAIRAIVFDWGNTLMRGPRAELVPGAAVALAGLPDELLCCVATNAPELDAERLGLVLEQGGIRGRFAHLFTPRELGALKPSPLFFRRVLAGLGVAPSAAIMVGDDYATDICPAKAVGMRTIWLAPMPINRPTPCADAVITTMEELVPAVARIQAETSGRSE